MGAPGIGATTRVGAGGGLGVWHDFDRDGHAPPQAAVDAAVGARPDQEAKFNVGQGVGGGVGRGGGGSASRVGGVGGWRGVAVGGGRAELRRNVGVVCAWGGAARKGGCVVWGVGRALRARCAPPPQTTHPQRAVFAQAKPNQSRLSPCPFPDQSPATGAGRPPPAASAAAMLPTPRAAARPGRAARSTP